MDLFYRMLGYIPDNANKSDVLRERLQKKSDEFEKNQANGNGGNHPNGDVNLWKNLLSATPDHPYISTAWTRVSDAEHPGWGPSEHAIARTQEQIKNFLAGLPTRFNEHAGINRGVPRSAVR
jgi:hypothetical protein